MEETIPLFEVNPGLDRKPLAERFASERRVQVRDVLTLGTAREIHNILARHTPWGISWQAALHGPHHVRMQAWAQRTPQQAEDMGSRLTTAMKASDYAFAYAAYPMVDAYKEKWDPDSPQDLLLEHINDEPFLNLVREITDIPELVKADAQATLYAPGHFLSQHNDSHIA